MLTYSVVVVIDNDFDDVELVLQIYSNEVAAKEHEKFVEDNLCYVDGNQWDYVFIRETLIADEFVKGEWYDI